jgi:SPP1 family predicted phage head-tail adaptor
LIQSGKLRHAIEIQKRTMTSSGMGLNDTETWTKRHSTRAEFINVGGRFKVESMRVEMQIDCIWRIRYLSNIDKSDRIKFGDRYFEIKHILNPEERNIELKIYCEEIT